AAPLEEYLWRFPHFEERLRRHFFLQAGLEAAVRLKTDGTSPGAEISEPRIDSCLLTPGPDWHVPCASAAPPAETGSAAGFPIVPGYEIVEQIGGGGMGIVYKARETSLGRYVAVKLLREDHARAPDQLARFLREARTASALNHPAICTVHALCEHEGRPFIVMELIEGTTLRKMIERRPQSDEVARLIGQAALALAAAHAAGVVHR